MQKGKRTSARRLADHIVELLHVRKPKPLDLHDPTTLDVGDKIEIDPDADAYATEEDRDFQWQLSFDSDASEAIHELMESWLQARCNIGKWSMRKQVEEDINRARVRLTQEDGRPRISTRRLPRYYKYYTDMRPGYTWASQAFVDFITGPFYASIRPCKRCGKYLLGTPRKKFCSRRCARHYHTIQAVKRARQRRRAELKEKIMQAVREIEGMPATRLSRLRTHRKSWKHEVADSVPEVSVRFLTLLVENGELTPPKNWTESS